MKRFTDIEDLALYMFDKGQEEEMVSVVADENIIIALMKELLEYDNVILDMCDINNIEYDKEYILSLYGDDENFWHFEIDPAYNYDKEKYFGTDGFVLFYEDVPSTALVDMQNNKDVEMSGYEIFSIDEVDEFDEDDEVDEDEGITETEDTSTDEIHNKPCSQDKSDLASKSGDTIGKYAKTKIQ